MAPSTGWHDFAVMTGGASGALTGLLFVAVSLNADRIAKHRGLRASAAQTLVLFLVPLVMAMVLLAPGQADGVLGGELIAAGLGASLSLLAIGQRKRGLSDDDKRLVSIFDRPDTNVVVMAAGRAVARLLDRDDVDSADLWVTGEQVGSDLAKCSRDLAVQVGLPGVAGHCLVSSPDARTGCQFRCRADRAR